MSLVQWFLIFWRNIVSTQPGDSLTCMQLWWLLFPGPLTVRRAPSILHSNRGGRPCCSAWTGSGWCPPCSLSVLLIASLVLSPLCSAGFEPFMGGHWWLSSLSLHVDQSPFQGHGHTPWHLQHIPVWLTTFLSLYYPVILHLSVSSIHPLFGILLGPVHLWRWRHCFSSKFLELPTQPCSMISQKTWIRINSVRISDLAINYL